jgi:hypothetical protein
MMASPNKPSSKKPVFDVSKPGKSAPNASSRPIIVGHKIMQDPMVSSDNKEEDPEQKVDVRVSSSGKSVAPPSSSKAVIEPSSEEKEKPDPVSGNEKKPEGANSEEQTDEKPETDSAETEGAGVEESPAAEKEDSSAVVDAVVEQADSKKKKDEMSEQDKAKQEAINELIDQKKYFVKISPAGRRRWPKIAILTLLFAMVFGGGGALLAADAGLIDLGFDPPFNFIINKTDTTDTT